MSSILKALQKLDNDKAVRQSKEPDISSEIIKDKQRNPKRPVWLLPVIMTAVVACSVLVTFTLMGGFSTRQQPAINKGDQNSSLQPTLNISNNQPLATTTSNQVQAAIPAPQMIVSSKNVKTPQTASINNNSKLQHQSSPPDFTTVDPTRTESVQPQNSQTPDTDHAESKSQTFPTLKIDGIAWQKDSASRLAVVNGQAVAEGGIVEGAKVEQISPDRVRFSIGGKFIDVSLEREYRR